MSIDDPDLADDAGSPAESLVAAGEEDRLARTRALRWMPLWFFLPGFATGFWGEGDLFDIIVQGAGVIGFLTLVHRWCGADARLRGESLWPYFLMTLVVCPGPALVVPIYLIRSRGVRGLLSSLLAALYLVLLFVIEIIGGVLGIALSGEN